MAFCPFCLKVTSDSTPPAESFSVVGTAVRNPLLPAGLVFPDSPALAFSTSNAWAHRPHLGFYFFPDKLVLFFLQEPSPSPAKSSLPSRGPFFQQSQSLCHCACHMALKQSVCPS